MQRFLKSILLLSIVAALTSCEDMFQQTVTIDIPEHEPKLVASCFLSAGDSVITVFVGRSRSSLDNSDYDFNGMDEIMWDGVDNVQTWGNIYDTAVNVTVEIYRDNQLWVTVPKRSRGWHQMVVPVIPSDAATYTLKVSADGLETITAEAQMPTPVTISEATYTIGGGSSGGPFSEDADLLKVNFTDPEGGNYYMIRALRYTPSTMTSNEIYLESNDPSYSNSLMTDEAFDGREAVLLFDAYSWQSSTEDVITVQLRSVTKDFYFFRRSVIENDNAQGNPFAEPVIVRSNINGGYGIFTVQSDYKYVIQ